jgi:Amt family ammonium transporter
VLAEWASHRKPSAFGIVSGAVGRLVAIGAGVGCFYAATKLKRTMHDRDLLGVFGVRAGGGIAGEMLTGVLCVQRFGSMSFAGENASTGAQVTAQLLGVVATIVYTAMVSHLI